MTELTITVHNLETGEIIEREINSEELTQRVIDIEKNSNAEQLIIEQQSVKAAARQAILDRLGLTQEEVALLLGGN